MARLRTNSTSITQIDEIPFEEHECFVELPPAERAIYMELETHLESLEMNSKSAQRSKKQITGDRQNRMQKVLQESASGEEALLKCCSHFDLTSDSSTAVETVDKIIALRESEKQKLEQEMIDSLTAALRHRKLIVDYQPDWMSVTVTEKGEKRDALGVYLGQVENNAGVPHGADEEVNDRVKEIMKQAESNFLVRPLLTQRDCDFFPDEEGYDSVEEGNNAGKSKQKTKREKKTPSKEELYEKKQILHNHMVVVRSLAKELCGRYRSLRYIQHIRRYQEEVERFKCPACDNAELSVSDVGVLSCCGHAGCLSCLRNQAADGHCVVPLCTARVSPSHVVAADTFGGAMDESTGKYGRKLSAVTDKVKRIVEEQGDRVIVFCQFGEWGGALLCLLFSLFLYPLCGSLTLVIFRADDLSAKVKEALASAGIKALEVKGTVTQQISTIAIFQKDEPAKGDPRVLMLKLDDEQSAGLNLTHLNHAVFVHPLLAGSQQEYDAYETQAIGRLRRFGTSNCLQKLATPSFSRIISSCNFASFFFLFHCSGQKKTVHVWRFLAKDTIDTTIFSQRSGRSIVAPEEDNSERN